MCVHRLPICAQFGSLRYKYYFTCCLAHLNGLGLQCRGGPGAQLQVNHYIPEPPVHQPHQHKERVESQHSFSNLNCSESLSTITVAWVCNFERHDNLRIEQTYLSMLSRKGHTVPGPSASPAPACLLCWIVSVRLGTPRGYGLGARTGEAGGQKRERGWGSHEVEVRKDTADMWIHGGGPTRSAGQQNPSKLEPGNATLTGTGHGG